MRIKISLFVPLLYGAVFACDPVKDSASTIPFGFDSDSIRIVKVVTESNVLLGPAMVSLSIQDSLRKDGTLFFPFKVEFTDSTVYHPIRSDGLHIGKNSSTLLFGTLLKVPRFFGLFRTYKFCTDTLTDFSQPAGKVYRLEDTYGLSWNTSWKSEGQDTIIVLRNSIYTETKYKLYIKNGEIDHIVLPDIDPEAKYL
jgi:hypothetical protein